ncbi:pentapeptide repeat-containing protein [Gloeobacter kilaueensis]|uniref:Pentapeptide repeat-containing protein n=1 Tax=Gloeobacter kilaueensis (strain ATCC BAA-2537 / CCAP 1431/1 / ULC 316 / JS1) TaxID=1183438 RepID=U5QRB7_GLOK1|nr:pentapeptide repeat-containing protein [Gloeobacter kilaueensis]AGY60260.1 pentapeptide repeat-containing protein [Gloeobacter kilaueensis JS1]
MQQPLAFDVRAFAARFLAQPAPDRLRTLQQLGLSRYSLFLTQMALTPANIVVAARFLGNPDRVKFPDLRGVELAGLDLSGVNWIRGDLSSADLHHCKLIRADLLFVRFDRANLSGADLGGATLNETRWSGTLVDGCHFGTGHGLTAAQRYDLQARGGQFAKGDFANAQP